ncbi:hypothetical protein PT276_00030 [Orbaceae bacterium ESL0721]|nr:hypothetical protein [Orbaceae bacterium ESL0721]
MKERNGDAQVDDSLIKLWQAEIDKYANLKQEKWSYNIDLDSKLQSTNYFCDINLIKNSN